MRDEIDKSILKTERANDDTTAREQAYKYGI